MAEHTEHPQPPTPAPWPAGAAHLVVSGPTGSGKSTVGRLVATALGRVWVEGDAFHPVANREKMAAGTPLDDNDRAPWLDRLAAELGRLGGLGLPAVLACSALRRAHRDVLRSCGYPVTVVQILASPDELRARLASRREHFMPESLVDSQAALMEPLAAGEDGITVVSAEDPQATASRILDELGFVLSWD